MKRRSYLFVDVSEREQLTRSAGAHDTREHFDAFLRVGRFFETVRIEKHLADDFARPVPAVECALFEDSDKIHIQQQIIEAHDVYYNEQVSY